MKLHRLHCIGVSRVYPSYKQQYRHSDNKWPATVLYLTGRTTDGRTDVGNQCLSSPQGRPAIVVASSITVSDGAVSAIQVYPYNRMS